MTSRDTLRKAEHHIRLGEDQYLPDFVEESPKAAASGHKQGMGTFTCSKHGQYQQVTYFLESQQRWLGTECITCNRIKAEQAELEGQAKMQHAYSPEGQKQQEEWEALNRVARVGAPPYLQGVNFTMFKAKDVKVAEVLALAKDYAKNFPEYAGKGTSMVMVGNTGTGKTMLAYCIAHGIAYRHDKIARVSKVYDMINTVKSSWGKDAQITESEALAKFIAPPLLVVDEVGVQFGSETEKDIFFRIMNARYESMKPTIMISNLSLDNLRAFAGDRVVDRMKANGGKILVFDWKSYR